MRLRHVLLFIFLLLPGCLSSPKLGPGLPELVKGFSESMRWKDFSTAASYVVPQSRDAFLLQFQEDKDLFVVGSQVQSVQLDSAVGEAEAVYVLEYYRLPSSRIKEWRWTQRWQMIEKKDDNPGFWMIANAPPPLPWKR